MKILKRKKLTPLTLAVTREAIMTYAEITGDFNPIHVDPEFARTTSMGGIIAHGTLSLNLVWQSLETTFGSESLNHTSIEIRFVKPVHISDVVTAGGERQEAQEQCCDIWVMNQYGIKVIEGVATLSTHQI